jgi:hypothetical protein
VKNNPLPLPAGRTLLFVHVRKNSGGYFACSTCKKKFAVSDPAEGMRLFNQHTCAAPKKKQNK